MNLDLQYYLTHLEYSLHIYYIYFLSFFIIRVNVNIGFILIELMVMKIRLFFLLVKQEQFLVFMEPMEMERML